MNSCETTKNEYKRIVTVRGFTSGKSVLEKLEGEIKKGSKGLAFLKTGRPGVYSIDNSFQTSELLQKERDLKPESLR